MTSRPEANDESVSAAGTVPANRLTFAIPGDPDQLTGGYLYNKRLVGSLRAHGIDAQILRLPDGFPHPDAAAAQAAGALLAAVPDGGRLLVDGMAAGVMPQAMAELATRLRLTVLVHHPLGYETGLDPARAAALVDLERAALAPVRHILVTSAATRDTLVDDFAVQVRRITVAIPGTEPAPVAAGSGTATPTILAVGSVIPRKAFPTLVEALATLAELPWHLTIAGSLTRDPAEAQRLAAAIDRHGLQQRVVLAGEVEPALLQGFYHRADLMVSVSVYEGFGMALAEATAHALPVVAVAGGAVGGWLRGGGAVLVPPDDPQALRTTLSKVLADPAHRAKLKLAALADRSLLPGWADTAAQALPALYVDKR